MNRPITIKIKRLSGARDVPLPVRMSGGAAGFDLHAAIADAAAIGPGGIRVVPCGLAMAIPPGYEAQIRPRSGLASRHGITVVNSPGTVDSDYRGEIKVALINLGREAFRIEPGMRIAQIVILPVPQVELVEVDELDATARGAGGFGHTGE
jgi:dUTP pyrophosphatase